MLCILYDCVRNLCFLHFTNSQIGCVRPHIDFRAQIYNIFLNCANAQPIFCTKKAKKRKKYTNLR